MRLYAFRKWWNNAYYVQSAVGWPCVLAVLTFKGPPCIPFHIYKIQWQCDPSNWYSFLWKNFLRLTLLLQEHPKVSKCGSDFQILPWGSVFDVSSVLPSSWFLLSVDMPWQAKSFVFSFISATALKMRFTLKLLAGQNLPEALWRIGFRLHCSFRLVYLNLNMGFKLC